MTEILEADVLVIGGGLAGCRAAIEAAENNVETIIADRGIIGRFGATNCALWSIQAPFGPKGIDPRDSPEQMFKDIVIYGRWIGNQNVIEVIAYTACDRILDLERYGVKFRKTEDGRFYQTPFPGQTYPRSVFVEEDGHAVATIIAAELAKHENVTMLNNFFAFELLKSDGQVVGALGLDLSSGDILAIKAKSVILACGGYTGIWDLTDNPPTLTGAHIAMSYRAGAELVNLEFNDFYGTDLVWPPSVRGTVVLYELLAPQFTDGNLYDKDWKPILPKPLPVRDEAMRIIYQVIREGRGTPHGGVWYDVTRSTKGKDEVRKIYETMTPKHYEFIKKAAGIDLVEEPIEVAPAVHYSSGGVYINEKCEASVPGLYAAGESAGGYQGANRLAGMGLAAAHTLGAQAGKYAAIRAKQMTSIPVSHNQIMNRIKKIEDKIGKYMKLREDGMRPANLKKQIRQVVGKALAPIRNEQVLENGLKDIIMLREKMLPKLCVPDVKRFNLALMEAIEAELMLDVAELAIRCALFRKESRGHHYREDYPQMDDKNWRVQTIIKMEAGKPKIFTRKPIYTKLMPQEVS